MEEVEELLRKLQPVLGDRTEALWRLALTSKDPSVADKNLRLLKILASRFADTHYSDPVRLPPPDSEVLSGDLYLGEVLYPEKEYGNLRLRNGELPSHVLISGMTGTGKTNAAFQILRELQQQHIPFIVFDWKGNYRELARLQEFKSIQVLRIGSSDCPFRFNPLIPPPGVNPRSWLTLLVDVMKHAFFVGHGVEYYLRRGVDAVYSSFGVYEGSNTYPTFHDLQRVLLKEYTRGREMLWMSSAKRVLSSLTFAGLLGTVMDTKVNKDLDDVICGPVVIEMDELSALEKTFFVESVLLWLYHYYKNNSDKQGGLRQVIVLEEAHHVLSAKKERSWGEETVMESTIRMIREYGVGIVAIDQEPSKISDSMLANSNCKMTFNLGNGKDIRVMSQAMNLSRSEQAYLDKLKVGHGIVKIKSRFSEAVHVRFPYAKIERNGHRAVGFP